MHNWSLTVGRSLTRNPDSSGFLCLDWSMSDSEITRQLRAPRKNMGVLRVAWKGDPLGLRGVRLGPHYDVRVDLLVS